MGPPASVDIGNVEDIFTSQYLPPAAERKL
jgi:hypothetical protein